jgi:tRNA U34 2-thiouridine synthase MnmA/TrmU
MMSRAKAIMEAEGADFVFTGEVLGQRPKSQRRDTLRIIERESGLDGRLLRPLSAKLLPPTLPEKEGLVDRERLEAISGRSRHRQMELARELGVTDWPQPAGGCCYLTDESFGKKFFDILDAREAAGEERRIRREDVVLLSTGRHFRLSPRAKLIVGRTEVENALLEHHVEGRARLEARDVLGPVALVEGEPTWEERVLAARMVARYGKGKDLPRVAVEWREGELVETYEVEPERDEARIERLRVG